MHAGSSGSSSDVALVLRADSKESRDCTPDAPFLNPEPVVLSSGLRQMDENPTHAYSAAGMYTVTLYLFGTGNDSKKIRYDYIVVA